MDLCTHAPLARRSFCCALIGLLAWAAGCNQNKRETEHSEISGKVLIDNKPLPGGQISFVSVKDGFAASGNIDENGNYQIKAPVGEVTITVNNGALQTQGGGVGKKKGGAGGGRAPKDLPHPKGENGEGLEAHAPKGHWVSIPSRYTQADTSELKYAVKPGPQTYDVKLTSAAPPPR